MTPARYKDPTFEAAARNESRDCHGCEHLVTLWGISQCQKLKWKSEKQMKRCELWRWGGNQ